MAILSIPRGWNKRVRWGILNTLALARTCFMDVMATKSVSRRKGDRTCAENTRLRHEVELLREEIRIKDARMGRVPCRRRPYYSPVERMAILEQRALRGWSLERAARVFLVSRVTLSNWMGRARRGADEGLLCTRAPVNRFPDFVRYIIQVLKLICPQLGKVKIAQFLCRAGLHLSASTVGRVLREPPAKKADSDRKQVLVVADRPNQVWHIDLTTVPIADGFATPFGSCTLPQRWPFGWWIAVVLDQFSRRVLSFEIFRHLPNASDVCRLLQRTIRETGARPEVIVSDGGGQFKSDDFRDWCHWLSIRPRRGRIGQHSSIMILDRFLRTLKEALTGAILVPFRRDKMITEVQLIVTWYNQHRPHSALGVCTPDEIYHERPPACRQPRIEPRPRWPKNAPCAAPPALALETPRSVHVKIGFLEGRKHLPIITLKHAA